MHYCAIVQTKTETSIAGDERWVLTHQCGKVEKRLKRKRGKRTEKPAPTKVACAGSQ